MDLPPELLFEIFLQLDLSSIGRVGQVCRLFHYILESDSFWRQQLMKKYGSIPIIKDSSWKEIYQTGGTLWSVLFTLQKVNEIQTPYDHVFIWKKGRFFWKDRPIRDLVTSYYQAGLIDQENRVWVWGQNIYGQLGLGDFETRTTPTQVPDLRAKQIAIGPHYSLLLDVEGQTWMAGEGIDRFILIPDKRVVSIAVGEAHIVLLDDEGRIWVRGANSLGQLGLGHTRDQHDFVQLPNFTATEISAGAHHTLFIDRSGIPWGCGYNIFGQLGTGDYNERHRPVQLSDFKVRQIGSTGYSTALIDMKQQVWFAGNHNPIFQSLTSFWASRFIMGDRYHFLVGLNT